MAHQDGFRGDSAWRKEASERNNGRVAPRSKPVGAHVYEFGTAVDGQRVERCRDRAVPEQAEQGGVRSSAAGAAGGSPGSRSALPDGQHKTRLRDGLEARDYRWSEAELRFSG